MSRSHEHRFVSLLTFTFLLTTLNTINTPCNALDTINTSQVITDGETLISSEGSFELGFFSPGNSKNRYVGIWYKNISDFTVIWVANRDHPLRDSSGSSLKLTDQGNLLLLDGNKAIVWSTNYTTQRAIENPIAKLLDSGNLVIKEASDDSSENYLWQGFDHPTDTQLPGMKLGWNFITGLETFLTSWKSSDDPGTGDYTFRMDMIGYPQLVIRRNNSDVVFRTGSWNGESFSSGPGLKKNVLYAFQFVYTNEEAYYRFDLLQGSVKSRLVLNYTGVVQKLTWADINPGWAVFLSGPRDHCDHYNQCRGYGICNIANSPICECLDRFVPKSPKKWMDTDWSDGCERRTPIDCKSDGFVKYAEVKSPDERYSWFNVSMSSKECEYMCKRNCSCMAYTSLDVRNGGSGCLAWFGDLVDIRQLYGGGRDIYIRMSSSELRSVKKKKKILIGSLTSFMVALFLGVFITLFFRRRRKTTHFKFREGHDKENLQHEDMELPIFDLSTITKATKDFSLNNKLGEGGFGPVYKGILVNGQEIAVKRLSKTSMQGLDEFKNEVIFIAKLQHRNLVRLLGCCIEGTEKMLIYEYMANRSLDLIVFDPTKSKQLDWPKRFQIITGIARGLMYLHQDSRLRIIHRDMKTSNILLDSNMNPKISDFGLARAFGGNEDGEPNISRVVGTYGYMSPEYAMEGTFSVKSDVFSFGVVVLEILSGKRNRGFSHENHQQNLLGHGWILYKEGRSMELVDEELCESVVHSSSDVLKTVHVGLLCVQENPEDRPSMSTVVFMLENDVDLPIAKEPGFFTHRRNVFASEATSFSTNEMTMTWPEPR